MASGALTLGAGCDGGETVDPSSASSTTSTSTGGAGGEGGAADEGGGGAGGANEGGGGADGANEGGSANEGGGGAGGANEGGGGTGGANEGGGGAGGANEGGGGTGGANEGGGAGSANEGGGGAGGAGSANEGGGGTGGAGGANEGGGGTGGAGGANEGGAGGGSVDACAELAEALQARLDGARVALGTPGAVLAVSTPGCGVLGFASGESAPGVPMRAEHVLRIGSVTKTYVAAAVLRLAHEGALDLDDPISTWITTFPGGDGITVRQLLNHSSGIFDYTEDAELPVAVLSDPARVWSPEEIVAAAAEHEPYFAPGDGWHYSSTNYILLGMIIEAATGEGVAAVIRERLLEPNALSSTSFDGEEPIEGDLARGYTTGGTDMTSIVHPSLPWSAGAMVASAGDVARWAVALYGGAALEPDSLAEMIADPVPTGVAGQGYGLGTLVIGREVLGVPALGHDGGIPGYATEMLYYPEQQAAVAAIVNSDTADPALIALSASGLLLESD
ncbi:serine hydrolase domain-containing protein [Sorangium sp. So ce1335]|uniref:serine hydrolase domain-containing protein n=1 Tax=Sorangium sp. So ce1335 TaxID=3133335 RepID=UPI003F6443BA